jgi:hypothetical protein
MKNAKRIALAAAFALAPWLGTAASAQDQANSVVAHASTQAILQQFHSPDWHVRATAFYKLVGPLEDEPPNAVKLNHGKEIDPAIRRALIDLLNSEADVLTAAPDLMPEEESEYWATLNQAVGGLHDMAALDVLPDRLPPQGTGQYDFAA